MNVNNEGGSTAIRGLLINFNKILYFDFPFTRLFFYFLFTRSYSDFLFTRSYSDSLFTGHILTFCFYFLFTRSYSDFLFTGHILTSPIACSLPTLPFLVLKSLYDSSPLTTDDGVLLRRMSLEIWAIHLILACLSVLSHHAPRVPVQGFQQEVGFFVLNVQSSPCETL